MTGVVITGVGLVSGLALDTDSHFERLVAGECALRVMKPLGASFPRVLEAPVPPFDRRTSVETRSLRRALSDAACFGLVAARSALASAGLVGDSERLREAGLFVGSVCLEATTEMLAPALRESTDATGHFDQVRFGEHGISLIDPLFLVRSLPNAGIGGIAIEHQLLGPNLNLTNGPVSGLQSVIAAAASIARGETNIAVAGAYDSALQIDSVIEHHLSGRLAGDAGTASEACRPFDPYSRGYGLGEGAAFVVLEAAESAHARNAPVLAAVLGFADHCSVDKLDALNTENPGTDSLLRAARGALDLAGTAAHTVDLVAGDALGVPVDDQRDAAVFKELFVANTRFFGATPAIGFTGSAASAFNLAHGVLALARRVVPPTLNGARNPSAPLGVRRESDVALERVLCWCSDRGIKSTALLLGAPDHHQPRSV
jgi:3-oxoacyl-[acyl-carrier-protein] synthase II